MATVVWIAAPTRVPRPTVSVAQRGQAEKFENQRIALEFPKHRPPWLVERLEGGEIDVVGGYTGRGKQDVQLWGMAKVSYTNIRFHSGPLSKPDEEGKLLLNIFQNPLDSALLEVEDAVSFVEPIIVTHRKTDAHRHRLALCVLL